jgi:cytochrome c oxidase subunit IV
MSEPDPKPTPSLIQQRHALRRNTIVWSVLLVLQALLAVSSWVRLSLDGDTAWYVWVMAISFTGAAAASVSLVVAARRATRRFEERHGPDAGLQP